MSRFSADSRLGCTPVLAVLCGALLVPHAQAEDHELVVLLLGFLSLSYEGGLRGLRSHC